MAYIALYLAAIVGANLAVAQWGPGVSIITAFGLIGCDLTCRDSLHERWQRHLWRNMALLIGVGSLLSWLVNRNAGQVALASFGAFALAGLADALVYQRLRHWRWMVKVNSSNIVAAAVDSVVFPALAFGWPLLIPIMLGQFVAKVAGGFVWSVLFDLLKRLRTPRLAETA